MISADNFITECLTNGYTFFTGVPCSFLKPLINYAIKNDRVKYVAASSEGEAVGIATGAYLAGRKSVVMCQNSGLGNTVNPLTSLNFPFRIPVLLIVTLRGEPGSKDEPQHELMGQITSKMLDTMRVPWSFFPERPEDVAPALRRAEEAMSSSGLTYAFIMRKGSVVEENLEKIDHPVPRENVRIEGAFKCPSDDRMQRMEAIRIIQKSTLGNDAIVATTGKIGRELFTLKDSDNQLYVVGSMGCASGIGFGVQYVLPNRRVIVLDGDGAALMKMGGMATIGYYQPSKFVHIILDNEAYESTGAQFTVSPVVDFCVVASACGYKHCYRVDSKTGLESVMSVLKGASGPSLIHVKVACNSDAKLGRPTLKPFEVKDRFMDFLKGNRANV